MSRMKKVSIMNANPLGNPFAYNSGGSSSFGNRLPVDDNNARITANSNSNSGSNYSMGLGAFNRQSNVGMSMPSSGIKIAKPKTTSSSSGQQSVGASGGSIFGGSYATKKRMEKSMMCKCGSGMSKAMCNCGANKGTRGEMQKGINLRGILGAGRKIKNQALRGYANARNANIADSINQGWQTAENVRGGVDDIAYFANKLGNSGKIKNSAINRALSSMNSRNIETNMENQAIRSVYPFPKGVNEATAEAYKYGKNKKLLQALVAAGGGSLIGGLSYNRKRRQEEPSVSRPMNKSMRNRSLSKAEMGLPTNFNLNDLKSIVNNLVGKATPYAQRALDATRRETKSFVGNAQGVGRQLKDFAMNEMMTGGIKPSGRSRIATNYEMALRGPKPAGASREPKAANRSAVTNENIPVYTLSGVTDRLKSFGKPTRRGQYDESSQLQRATQFVRDFGEYLSPTAAAKITGPANLTQTRMQLRRNKNEGAPAYVQMRTKNQVLGLEPGFVSGPRRQKLKDGQLVDYYLNAPKGPMKALTEADVAGKKVNPRMQIWETGTMAPRKNTFETIIPQKETFTYDTQAKRYRSDTPKSVGSEISEYERKPKGRPAGVAAGGMPNVPKLTNSLKGTLADYQYAQDLLANAGYDLNNVSRKKVDKRMSKGLPSMKMPKMYPIAASNRSMMKSISSMYQDGTKHVIGGYRGNIGKRFAGPKQNKYMD